MSDRSSTDRARSVWRILVFLGGIPAALVIGTALSGPFLKSENALAATAGLSGTFAGFIVAILTILGDASALLPGNWRVAALQAEEIENRALRLRVIFFCYLTAAFVSIYMVALAEDDTASGIFGNIYTALIVYCFIISVELPTTLRSIQQDRVTAILEQRMAQDKAKQVDVP